MVMSTEYPDLAWVEPRSWTPADRTSVQVVVIHDTEGSEGPTSAEDGAAYDARRTDGTSTHYFHDSNSTVQCVRTKDIAHAARTQGNRRGIQHEICGKAGQGASGWADDVSAATLERAAKQVARDCLKWNIPVRKLSPSQVREGQRGICGHGDITAAFPEDGGDHTDPGPTFPWQAFINRVMDYIVEDDMPSADDVANAVVTKLSGTRNNVPITSKGLIQDSMDKLNLDYRQESGIRAGLEDIIGEVVDAKLAPLNAKLDRVLAALQAKK